MPSPRARTRRTQMHAGPVSLRGVPTRVNRCRDGLDPLVDPDERTPRLRALLVARVWIVDRGLQLVALGLQLLQLLERREIARLPFGRALAILVSRRLPRLST